MSMIFMYMQVYTYKDKSQKKTHYNNTKNLLKVTMHKVIQWTQIFGCGGGKRHPQVCKVSGILGFWDFNFQHLKYDTATTTFQPHWVKQIAFQFFQFFKGLF